MIKKIKLSRTSKDKLLRMVIGLFPEYARITIDSSGMVKFFRKGLFKLFPRIKVHYLDLCLEGIPQRMSRDRFSNLELTAVYYKKLGALLKSDGISFMVDYLWDEFAKVRVLDVLYSVDSYIMALPNGGGTLIRRQLQPHTALTTGGFSEEFENVEVISSENSITRVFPRSPNTITLDDFLRAAKKTAAAVTLLIALNFTPLLATLKAVSIFPNFGQYSGM